ncbi:MAG: hypothetical protein COX62_04825 [Deltaproteobacteria bacterium CG_4_10_14_0_2_um_filter_43_8]|nr:MAG: hypothetical protein COV43_07940 [Deltaproteobacteria bacterium CG11_big_fil_rev_8_21_14_0_20_42_23]PJA20357.1 MAG: hypothetical protein COX62_04825 [Deltaproteobacteria bacterium CG_4_10_14_0_2_um_filter_43_8]PJC64143.1 MAG: hypothetical protein CO021_05715 [Deltaproteobacteria bacterium CG_4_9_14_0_2_um_filter_42_21]
MKADQRLRRIRSTLGLSQEQMAKELRVTRAALTLWETRKRAMPGPVLLILELYERELGFNETLPALCIQEKINVGKMRHLDLAKMTFQTALASLKEEISKLFSHQHKRSVENRIHEALVLNLIDQLGKLKGLPMKVGQMMSFFDFDLSEEERFYFSTLQQQSPSLPERNIIEIIVEEFGETPRQLFKTWEALPFSAASIGQVHKAVLENGKTVAVKVQYPGIRNSLEKDLLYAKGIDKILTHIFKGQEPGVWIEEIKARFLEECDYVNEAKNQEFFKNFFENDKNISIPSIIKEHSGRKVLTSEYVEGKNFASFCSHASELEKEWAAQTIFRFFTEPFLQSGCLHVDPHPGNFLFSSEKIHFLDFGCVKKVSVSFLEHFKNMLHSLKTNDKILFKQSCLGIQMTKQPEVFNFDWQFGFMKEWLLPWYHEKPVHLSPKKYKALWQKATLQNPNVKNLNFSSELIFLNHTIWAIYALFSHLRVELTDIP